MIPLPSPFRPPSKGGDKRMRELLVPWGRPKDASLFFPWGKPEDASLFFPRGKPADASLFLHGRGEFKASLLVGERFGERFSRSRPIYWI